MQKGLMSAIPGLSRHRPEPVAELSFSESAIRAVRETIAEIANMYPTGAISWISAERPEVRAYLLSSADEVDAAVLAEDAGRLTRSLARYIEAHRRAFQLFCARPTVASEGL